MLVCVLVKGNWMMWDSFRIFFFVGKMLFPEGDNFSAIFWGKIEPFILLGV